MFSKTLFRDIYKETSFLLLTHTDLYQSVQHRIPNQGVTSSLLLVNTNIDPLLPLPILTLSLTYVVSNHPFSSVPTIKDRILNKNPKSSLIPKFD
mmetsp:Transcript_16233/g.30709  ORF Transcript_16233/g.30709 Transcript_16233/m.30709 type:complete len:95 (+) Transcript_16233:3022-3306(+)